MMVRCCSTMITFWTKYDPIGNHCLQGFSDRNGRKYVFRKADGRIMKFKLTGWCFYDFNNTHFPVSIHHFETKSIGEYIKNKIKKYFLQI